MECWTHMENSKRDTDDKHGVAVKVWEEKECDGAAAAVRHDNVREGRRGSVTEEIGHDRFVGTLPDASRSGKTIDDFQDFTWKTCRGLNLPAPWRAYSRTALGQVPRCLSVKA